MKAKTYKFPCDCLDKGDVKLEVFDMGQGEWEIGGVFLNEKSVRKLVALLVPKLIKVKSIQTKRKSIQK